LSVPPRRAAAVASRLRSHWLTRARLLRPPADDRTDLRLTL
jgi:hypothetical protein